MKKYILILFSFLFVFSLKINAYEYLYYERVLETGSGQIKDIFLTDGNNRLLKRAYYFNGNIINTSISYIDLYRSKISQKQTNNYYYYNISEYYKNDFLFLNDLYIQYTNQFLNYLYNDNEFNNNNYVNYDDYELLYNSDGLAIESIVNGIWAGLYNDNQKQYSGLLYSQDGRLLYVNGNEASFFQQLCEKIGIWGVGDMLLQTLSNDYLSVTMKVLLVITMLIFVVHLVKRIFVKGYKVNGR